MKLIKKINLINNYLIFQVCVIAVNRNWLERVNTYII